MKQTPIDRLLEAQSSPLVFSLEEIKSYERQVVEAAYERGFSDGCANERNDCVRFQNGLDYYEKTFGNADGAITVNKETADALREHPLCKKGAPKQTTFTVDEELETMKLERHIAFSALDKVQNELRLSDAESQRMSYIIQKDKISNEENSELIILQARNSIPSSETIKDVIKLLNK